MLDAIVFAIMPRGWRLLLDGNCVLLFKEIDWLIVSVQVRVECLEVRVHQVFRLHVNLKNAQVHAVLVRVGCAGQPQTNEERTQTSSSMVAAMTGRLHA